MMLFNCKCFYEMTIPGNVLPKIFSVPWDEAPPRDSDHAECARSLLYDSVLVFSVKVLGVRRYGGYVVAGGKTLTPWDSPQ